ncbi:MAG TPA: prolyl oligopeptidase family serine peptidase [Steroidobacter sp.]|uniref:S9 family peptidase n=1 Tax=Steroidobacter sp. TaxID=1978227 RepID=UPI002EDAD240
MVTRRVSPNGGMAAWIVQFSLCLGMWATVAPAHAESHSDGLQIEDYFQLQRITELAMSPDARWLAYVVETHAGAENVPVRRVHLRSLARDNADVVLDVLADASNLAWIARQQRLAFLSARSGSTQVWSYDPNTRELRAVTSSADSIVSFRFSPDGNKVAYTTRREAAAGASLFEQFRTSDRGILIDPDTTSSHDFLNPRWQSIAKPLPLSLWIDSGVAASQVPVPGEPSGEDDAFSWSSDGRSLSVTYVASDMAPAQMRSERTSVGIFAVDEWRFDAIAKAVAPTDREVGRSFAGGEWIPGTRRILLRRVTETDPWVSGSFPEWAMVDAAVDWESKRPRWHPIEIYPRGLRFTPVSATRILLANTVRGVHSLFDLTPAGVFPTQLMTGVDGSSSLVQFDRSFRHLAFVNESLTRPPEIYVARAGAPRRLTNLNDGIAQRVRHRAREVSWNSTDGVTVSGWLLEAADMTDRPAPLITHVHGGPAFPFPNAFAPYFAYWPYPLEVYPTQGIAVFMPNYRGTHTYGRTIASGSDRQAMGDIITGIRSLIASGVADEQRLGISGHSHGAMLGPLTMARAGFFRSSSFAEGVANGIVMYEMMSGEANREIHDATVGGSLYDSPQLYLEQSPDLQFSNLKTASLFEGGSDAAALLMLGFPKAARRAGMPTEFIVYPQTGHNLTIPKLQKESAAHNLAWFEFWLLDREHSESDSPRHMRWREMKARAALFKAPGCRAGPQSSLRGCGPVH